MRRGHPSTGTILPLAAGATVFAFACGSSSVHVLGDIGRPVRWAVLLALLVAAGAWAADRAGAPRPASAITVAGGAFALIALISALWSVDPRLSFERAVTLAVLFGAAALIAYGAPGRIERVLAGLLAGGIAVALAGLVVLVVQHDDAIEQATTDLPARYRGMGESPDTVSLLLALLTAPALWFAVRGHNRRERLAALAALGLLVGSIVASGSHGAMVASAVGALAVALGLPGTLRRRAAGVVAIAAVTGAGFWVQSLPQPVAVAPPVHASGSPTPAANPGYTNGEINFPLSGELGIPPPGVSLKRRLFTSSGRLQAWGGAIRQAERRPVTGYGFGTESRVFVDRWSRFVGSVPENSYIGIALQLGAAGLVLFAVLVCAVAIAASRALRRPGRGAAVACLGTVAAGLAIAFVQSYVYSVGDIGTATLWIAAFLLPAASVTVHDA